MSRRIIATGLILSILIALFLSMGTLNVLALTATPAPNTATSTKTPTAAVCNPLPPTYYLTVSSSATSVNVGDQITVRETTNVGIGAFYLSIIDNATGLVQSATDPIFTPAAPDRQVPGGAYSVEWTLTAVRAGSVKFNGSVSGEVQVCSQGNLVYTWGNAGGQSGTVTVGALPTLTPTPTLTPNGALPDLIVVSITEYTWPLPTSTPSSKGCTAPWTGGRGVSITIKNIGAADAGAFVVSLNTDQKTVSGLAVGQTTSASFPVVPLTRVATVDATNVIAESDESNNTLTTSITPGPSPTGTRPATVCRTPTPTTITSTPTITSTLSRTPTLTLTVRTSTRTVTPSLTPTIVVADHCMPVTSTIAAPFTYDGAGAFCWQSSNLGSYVNSWNLTSLTINGLSYPNVYVAAGSYPAKIGGYWYVSYSSAVSYGHFEAK